jgi:urease subunit gamma/beta
MQLTPTEQDRLRVFTAAELARRSLARGLRLNAPEAVALVCDEMHLAAREGATREEVRAAGETALPGDRVLPGVANIVTEIRVEVLLDEGSRLIVLRAPFGPPTEDGPGAIRFGAGAVELAPGRRRIRLTVHNEGDRPIRVSSHFPFAEVNERLVFDRAAARGFRLDLPAGDSIRWEPGQAREVPLVVIDGPPAPTDEPGAGPRA